MKYARDIGEAAGGEIDGAHAAVLMLGCSYGLLRDGVGDGLDASAHIGFYIDAA